MKKVSVIAATTDSAPATRYTYGYNQSTNLNTQEAPLLTSITTPHPNLATSTATATLTYNDNGLVSYVTDGNGNKTQFSYSGEVVAGIADPIPANQTLVRKYNSSGGTPELLYYQKFDDIGRNTGTLDAEGNATSIQYGSIKNPDKPTQISDASGCTTSITYENNAYGLVNTVTSLRGSGPTSIETHYTYDYTWPFGLVTSVYETSTGGALTHPSTTFTYDTTRLQAGLVLSVTSANPNTMEGTATPATVTTSFTYNDFGDVTSVLTPGHGSFTSLLTSYNYTADGTYTQTAQKGEPVSITDSLGKVTGLRYDARGNVTSTRDALGNINTATYNIADETLVATQPATGQNGTGQGHTNYTYTYVGGPLKTTDLYDEGNHTGPIRSVSTTYGPEGEVRGTSGSTEPITLTYTSFYAIKSQLDGQGNQTLYSYNNLRGLPTQIKRPLGNTTTGFDVLTFNTYAADGRVTKVTDGRGIQKEYGYNSSDGQLASIQYTPSSGDNVALHYDEWGRPDSHTDASGSEAYTYSATDALLSTSTIYKKADGSPVPATGALVLNRVYYDDGLETSLKGATTSPASRVYLTYNYNKRGQLSQVGLGAGGSMQTATWGYYDNGWLSTQTDAPNGWKSTFTPNALGQTVSLAQNIPLLSTASPNLNFGGTSPLVYDGAGNMVTETAPWTNPGGTGLVGAGTTAYTYDSNDRLLTESSSRWNGYTRGYGYDAAYNRTSRTKVDDINTTPINLTDALTVTNRNRFTHISRTRNGNPDVEQSYTYDGEGNRITFNSDPDVGDTTWNTYGYDSENRLNLVTKKVGTTGATNTIFSAGYRADGLRAWKESYPGGVATRTYFLYDGDQLVAETDDTGTVRNVSAWGANGLVIRRYYPATGTGYYRHYLWDTRGNIAAVTDDTGAILSTLTSDGFSAGNGGEPVATFGGQFGGYQDTETGLILFQNRYYVPSTGTWLTRDPVGEAGGINLYSYVQGNTVNRIDPDGLRPVNVSSRTIVERTRVEQFEVDFAQMAKQCTANANNFIVGSVDGGSLGQVAEEGVGQSSKVLLNGLKQLEKKWYHAKDFGVLGNFARRNGGAEFSRALNLHINEPGTLKMLGTYQGKNVIHYLNPSTGLDVIDDLSGKFVSSFKLGEEQLANLIFRGHLR